MGWVLYFPTWLAPNIITLIGLLFTLSSHLLLAYHCPYLEGPIPPLLAVWNGVAVLLYQAFDAMDGKQARRTGSGSPLGLLFDHGCDAFNTTVMMVSMACALQLGPTWESALLCGVGQAGFFAATLEEYFTGELHLPMINGPNEGLQVGAMVHFVAAFVPPQWFRSQVSVFGIRRNQLALAIF